MKRRIVAVLLILWMSMTIAHAETVQEQVNAPEQVQDTFTSNTGKTVIDIDAPVHVPDASTMYVIPIKPTTFNDDMVIKLASLLWPELSDQKMEIEDQNDLSEDGVTHQKTRYFRHSASLSQYGTKNNDVDRQVLTSFCQYPGYAHETDAFLQAIITYDERYRLKKTINYNSPYMQQEVTGDGIEGHPFTSIEIAAITDRLVCSLTTEDFSLFALGQAPGVIYDDARLSDGTAWEHTGFSYVAVYARNVENAAVLPCLGVTMNSSPFRDDLYVPPVGYEQILLSINREGEITTLLWSNPTTICGEKTAQVLLPFETILSIARQTMPLKYQAEEVNGAVHYRVFRIDLGYMSILQRDTLTFALTPVWNFYGNVEPAKAQYTAMPLLTVNAVDGTVIDLTYGY